MKESAEVTPRSLTARGAATRARIVETAATLIYDRGVGGTSLDDVMAASATSKSQLYHYFADREALIGAVIEAQASRVLAFRHLCWTRSRRWQACVVGGMPLSR